MRDLNFFEHYTEKVEFKVDKKLIYFVISIFIFLFFSANVIFNSIGIRQEMQIVDKLRTTAENPRTVMKVEEIKSKEIELNEFRESVDKIRHLDDIMAERDIIDENLLETITSKMPNDLFLTSVDIYNREGQIVGIAKDKWSIAELEKGLEDLQGLEDIFVSNISLQGDYYNFAINIKFKDVCENGEEVAEAKDED